MNGLRIAVVLLSLPLCSLATAPSMMFDLLTDTGAYLRIYGHAGNGQKGTPVTGGFDCDGDGYNDYAFSGIQTTPFSGRTNAGEVMFLFGDGTVIGERNTIGFNTNMLKFAGDQPYEVAGSEIWMDDVNGDSLGDLLICRQNFTPDNVRTGAGALTVVFGSTEWRTEAGKSQHVDLRSMPTNLSYITFVGSNGFDRLGIWTRTGDVDGDGVADIVVGADLADGAGNSSRGAGYVIRGGTHLLLTNWIDLAHYDSSVLAGHIARIDPPEGSAGYHLGATVQIADLDNNGKGEVLLAATLNRAGAGIGPYGMGSDASGGAPRGMLFIAWDDYFPTNLWAADYQFSITNLAASYTAIQGDIFNISFGEEMIGGLDYDGDGKAELFSGDLVARGINNDKSLIGVGHMFFNAATLKGMDFSLTSTPTGLVISVIEGPINGSIGADTVAHGDFDGDGLADLAYGNPHDEFDGRVGCGTVHVLYGQPEGWPAEIRLNSTDIPDNAEVRIAQINGAVAFDTLCYSAAAGDINHDGTIDFIVNEMTGDGRTTNGVGDIVSANNVGNLVIISGKALLGLPNRIVGIEEFSDTNLTVSFFSNTNETYSLEASQEIDPQTWMNVTSTITGNGSQKVVQIVGPTNQTLFYRVRKE